MLAPCRPPCALACVKLQGHCSCPRPPPTCAFGVKRIVQAPGQTHRNAIVKLKLRLNSSLHLEQTSAILFNTSGNPWRLETGARAAAAARLHFHRIVLVRAGSAWRTSPLSPGLLYHRCILSGDTPYDSQGPETSARRRRRGVHCTGTRKACIVNQDARSALDMERCVLATPLDPDLSALDPGRAIRCSTANTTMLIRLDTHYWCGI